MNFCVLPPEITSMQLYTGAGAGPMLAAAASWAGLGSELATAAESFASMTSGLTGQAWQGAAATAMTAAAVPPGGGNGATFDQLRAYDQQQFERLDTLNQDQFARTEFLAKNDLAATGAALGSGDVATAARQVADAAT